MCIGEREGIEEGRGWIVEKGKRGYRGGKGVDCGKGKGGYRGGKGVDCGRVTPWSSCIIE